MTNRKLHMCAFDWHQGQRLWMILNCYVFLQFSRNFVRFCRFGRQQRLNEYENRPILLAATF